MFSAHGYQDLKHQCAARGWRRHADPPVLPISRLGAGGRGPLGSQPHVSPPRETAGPRDCSPPGPTAAPDPQLPSRCLRPHVPTEGRDSLRGEGLGRGPGDPAWRPGMGCPKHAARCESGPPRRGQICDILAVPYPHPLCPGGTRNPPRTSQGTGDPRGHTSPSPMAGPTGKPPPSPTAMSPCRLQEPCRPLQAPLRHRRKELRSGYF